MLVAGAAPAAAQGSARNELAIFAGVSLANPETSESSGPLPLRLSSVAPLIFPLPVTVTSTMDGSTEFGARYSRHVTDIVAVEGDFSMAAGHELADRIQFRCPDNRVCIAGSEISFVAPDRLVTERVVAYHYGAGLGVDLTRGAVRPVLIAGVGGVTHNAGDLRDTQFTLRVGGALEADIGTLTTRVEVLDVIAADHFVTHRSEHDIHVRVGLGVRWCSRAPVLR
jgi:hypothetical protein